MTRIIPSIGRTVHFTLQDGPSAGQVRPAVIVNLHTAGGSPANEQTLVNLQVLMDGDGRAFGDHAGPLSWKTSVPQGTEPGQWFYPAPAAAAHAVPPKVAATK